MINQYLTQTFGCNPENFKEIGEKINKMVWEQVLLLMLYTRQQLIEQDTIGGRVKLEVRHKPPN